MVPSNDCLKLAILTVVLLAKFSKAQDAVVDIEDLGKIRGEWMYPIGSFKPYTQFTGIPYAKSPEGQGRFLPAEETGPLSEPGQEFDATKEGNSCVQPAGIFSLFNPESHDLAKEYMITGNDRIPKEYEEKTRTNTRAFLGTEDCLNLNVYSPNVTGRLYPVIVFVHGGSFTSGNAFVYGPSTFFKHDIIIVTVNYRLGALGFFSLETDEAPGNAALYDVLSSLRWVQKYITHFGGDPNKVTLMGQSSGGAVVSHLMLSPLSLTPRQLFHRAIILSASALSPWATTDSPVKASLRIAELAGCYDPTAEPPRDHPTIVECMKMDASADDLVAAIIEYQAEERKAGRLGTDVVAPTIQRAGADKIITKRPMDVLTNREQMNIPLMIGAMRHEGSYPLGILYNRFLNCETCGELQNNATFLRTKLIPMMLESMGVHDDSGAVHESLAMTYLGDRRFTGNFPLMTYGLIDIQSVFMFKFGAYRNMELHAQRNADTYWYTFDHLGEYTMFPFLFPYPPPPIPGGVAHGDDIMYLFPFESLNDHDKSLSDRLIDYYRNFAFHGNPNVFPLGVERPTTRAFLEWPEWREATKQHLIINKDFFIGENYASTWTDASLELEPEPEPEPTTTTTTPPTTPTTIQPGTTTTTQPGTTTTTQPGTTTTTQPGTTTTTQPGTTTTTQPGTTTTTQPGTTTTTQPGTTTTTQPGTTTTTQPGTTTTTQPGTTTTVQPPTTTVQPPTTTTEPITTSTTEQNGVAQNSGQILLLVLMVSLIMINLS